ncbi:MAG: catechol 2,3-dioxygenase-like lactoylglutathione lyase family enzyme [Hyphomicrobiaceae bacterium]|jgi:catechol 2,3-dioxygenase-like lactoylglutathione lyase family enzyme
MSAIPSPEAVHHIALCTNDMKEQIEFFTQALGMELVALFEMHGVPGGRHSFLRLGDHCSLSFVELPDGADVEIEIGKTHAGNGSLPCAPGTMQHLALRAPDEAALLGLRDRLRSHGINVFGPIDHGMCKSIYFAGPEQLTLEIATSEVAVDAEQWIDPQVCQACGIDETDLKRFTNPTPFEKPHTAVTQPPIDRSKPHMVYPPKLYEMMANLSDEDLATNADYKEPPVPARKVG